MFKISLDKGYDYKNIVYKKIDYYVIERGYISHIPHRRKRPLSRIRNGQHHHQSNHYSRKRFSKERILGITGAENCW
jgi:hypothetical protein